VTSVDLVRPIGAPRAAAPFQGVLLTSNVRPVTTDTSWVGAAMQQSVPWVRTVGVEFGETSPERAVAHLPDAGELRNHVGGPHAAMIFGLGETASGAVGLAAFGATAERATPLVVRSEVHYLKLARGPLRAEAVLDRPAADVLAELDEGKRPEFAVHVTITDAEGRETSRMTVVWTLRPNRQHPVG
jgi:acyl-coenzyme A thioesterase PaaI-like protein